MDTKRMFLGMLVALCLITLYSSLQQYLLVKHPEWAPQPETPSAATQVSATQSAPATAAALSGTAPSSQALASGPAAVLTTAPAPAPAALKVVQQGNPTPLALGSAEFDPNWNPKTQGPYPLAITLDSRGAGVALAALNHFHPSSGQAKEVYEFEKPYESGGAMAAALATRCVWIDGVSCDLWNVDWQLRPDPPSKTSAVWFVEIADAQNNKLLKIEKHFDLHDATQEAVRNAGMGYEFDVTYVLINQSGRPLQVRLAFNGPNTPAVENNRDLAELFTGYDDQHTVLVHDPQAILSVKDRSEIDLRESKGHPLLWTAQRSNYFAAIVRTAGPDAAAPAVYAKICAQSQAADPKNAKEKDVAIAYETNALTLPAGPAPLTLPLHVYFGPTARRVLDSSYYYNFPMGYNQILVVAGGCCGICTFTWLINLLVWMLNGFHYVLGGDWGLAIIALVLIVRLVLHPITKRSQVSMTKMTKMAPEMERLKKKHGDDKEALNKAMMTFYREQGITPILGCLPMFLQMPIWIALWNALQSTFEIRQAPFLWGFTWIKDLSQPDQLVPLHYNLPLGIDAINLLPILMAVVFYIQQKMQPKPDPKTLSPEQAQQQKMMQWMSLMFPVFLYFSPSGLNLYILTSTTIGIYESKRIRDHIKEREEAEKEGKPPAAGGGGIGAWIGGIFANLQARAEAARGSAQGSKRRR